MSTRMLIIGMILAVAATAASAQGVSIGPQLGYQKSRDADDGKIMGGGAVRLRLTPALGVEGSIGYREEDYANGAIHVRNWPVMATGLIYPLPALYGAVGMGWYNSSIDVDHTRMPLANGDTKQAVGWHFGGGLELPTGGGSSLTADIRYVFLNYDFTAVPGKSVDSDFYVVTVGFLFGL